MSDQQQPALPEPTCTTEGKPCTEYGRTHLKFACPKCGVPWAMSGAGLHPCQCGALILVTAPMPAN